MGTYLDQVPADVRYLANQKTMGGEPELVQVDTETGAEIALLVKVNGEVFSKTDLENRQLVTLRQRGQPVDLKSGPSDQQLDTPGEPLPVK